MALALCLGAPGEGRADDLTRTIEALRQRIDAQQRQLERQERALRGQREELDAQLDRLESLELSAARARGPAASTPAARPAAASGDSLQPARRAAQAQAQAQPESGESGTAPSGEAEDAPREFDLTLIRERGGVLTPKGRFILEPELQFLTSSNNRFFFQGVEVVEAVLFGLIEASESERETVVAALGGRYGVTDRLEVDLRVPYVYRNDSLQTTGVNDPSFNTIRDLEGHGLGDIEFGAHYQINPGRGGWPLFVGNVRVKPPTGKGPFDVDRDENGLETELPTGAGFWSVEPSVTAIYPTDPAVLFANLAYSVNIATDVDERIPNNADPDGFTEIGEFDPGDTVTGSFGVGVGLNDRLSISLGYEHNFVRKSETEIDGNTSTSDSFHVASFQFGGNYVLSDSTSLDLRVEAGLTEEAPDARVTFRVPIAF